jgi:hypothetical protein
MIEVWCRRAWASLAGPRQKLQARTLSFVKRLPSKQTGIALTVAVPSLVFCWHLLALTHRPPDLDKIVA